MSGKLYIFMESGDDERFFTRVIIPLLRKRYPEIEAILYAEDQPKETRKYLKAITCSGDFYIFSRDLDDSTCIVARRESTATKYQIDTQNVIIVCKEIESWYLCGVKATDCKKIGIKHDCHMTDDVSKESFERKLPSGASKSEIFGLMLERYDIELGKSRNLSLRYFMRKWVQ